MKHRHSVILLLLSTIILLLSTCNKTGFDNDTGLFDKALQSSVTLSAGVIKHDIFDLEYGEIAYKYLEYIQDALSGRIACTKKERETAVFIVRTLLDIGYSTDSIQIQP